MFRFLAAVVGITAIGALVTPMPQAKGRRSKAEDPSGATGSGTVR
jgi:hypothetical protein